TSNRVRPSCRSSSCGRLALGGTGCPLVIPRRRRRAPAPPRRPLALAPALDRIEAREGGPGPDGGDEPGGPRQDEPRAGIDRLAEPARERAADRRRAKEDNRVERHHTPPHGRLGGELERRVDTSREGNARRAERKQSQHLERQRGRAGGDQRGG